MRQIGNGRAKIGSFGSNEPILSEFSDGTEGEGVVLVIRAESRVAIEVCDPTDIKEASRDSPKAA